jgi:hypothetical protein
MDNNPANNANLYQPIVSTTVGSPPLVVRAVITPTVEHLQGGPMPQARRVESYILLSALPEELRRRVELAVQALVRGM